MRIFDQYGFIEYSRIGAAAFYIQKIYIVPERRRQGFGTVLIQKLYEEIKSGEIYLIASNELGTPVEYLIAWYKKQGFECKTGTIRKNSEFEMKITIEGGKKCVSQMNSDT